MAIYLAMQSGRWKTSIELIRENVDSPGPGELWVNVYSAAITMCLELNKGKSEYGYYIFYLKHLHYLCLCTEYVSYPPQVI